MAQHADLLDDPQGMARWRRAIRHTANRAGLLLCGDLVTAASLLRAEGDEPAVEELARFAAGAECAALWTCSTARPPAGAGGGRAGAELFQAWKSWPDSGRAGAGTLPGLEEFA